MTVAELLRRVQEDPHHADELVAAFTATHAVPVLDEARATFLFHGRAESVDLLHWVYGLESRRPFTRIPRTKLWMVSVDLPLRSRVEYKLAVQRHGHTEWMRDPLNPHLAYDPFGANSVCRMTGYVDPVWAMPDSRTSAGTLDGVVVQSEVFGGPREVQLYLPAEYKTQKVYPLLVCHDGADYLKYAALRTVLDNLIARHEVRPLVVALTSGVKRNEEYAANPLQAAFLANELLPAVQGVARVAPDPRLRGLMGASFGAISSLFTAWEHPGVFGNLFLQSGSFIFTDVGHHGRKPLWDPVVDFVNAFRRDPARVQARIAMSCGIFENLITYNRALVPLMREAGLSVRFEERPDGHNWVGWRDSLRMGLTRLFPGHLWMTYD